MKLGLDIVFCRYANSIYKLFKNEHILLFGVMSEMNKFDFSHLSLELAINQT